MDNVPCPLPLSVAFPSTLAPALKVMSPVGVPLLPLTVAVRLTLPPSATDVSDALTLMVQTASVILRPSEIDVLGAKFRLPR